MTLDDLTLRCPTCGQRADMCFSHGDEWKKRDRYRDTTTAALQRMTSHELRAAVNEWTEDDPPPYGPLTPPPGSEYADGWWAVRDEDVDA